MNLNMKVLIANQSALLAKFSGKMNAANHR
jgi:hypothetical protein